MLERNTVLQKNNNIKPLDHSKDIWPESADYSREPSKIGDGKFTYFVYIVDPLRFNFIRSIFRFVFIQVVIHMIDIRYLGG